MKRAKNDPQSHSVTRHLRQEASREDATSLIETALLLPVLLLLLAAAVDLGRAFRTANALSSAAQAGAMYGTNHPTDATGMITAANSDSTGSISVQPVATFGCECSDGSSNIAGCTSEPTCSMNSVNYVQVDTSATYTPLIPWPGLPAAMQLHNKVRFRAAR